MIMVVSTICKNRDVPYAWDLFVKQFDAKLDHAAQISQGTDWYGDFLAGVKQDKKGLFTLIKLPVE